MFGIPVIVAINSFISDTENEINAVKKLCKDAGKLKCRKNHNSVPTP